VATFGLYIKLQPQPAIQSTTASERHVHILFKQFP
jgi:hypothetical protein